MDSGGILMAGADKPYQCNVCFKRFTQKAHLTTHRRTHTGEKPYACHICQKRFAQSSHLNSHKRTHTGEKPYYCVICSLGFCRKQRLEQHLREVHNEQGSLPDLSTSEFHQGFSGLNFPEFKTDIGNPANLGTASHRRKPNVVNRFSIEDFSSVGSSDNAEDGTDKANKSCHVKLEEAGSLDMDTISLPPDSASFPEPTSSLEPKPKRSRKKTLKQEKINVRDSNFTEAQGDSGDEADMGDGASVTSESNLSGSEISLSSSPQKCQLFPAMSKSSKSMARYNSLSSKPSPSLYNSSIGTNSRICLVNFTNEDLFTHMMSRDDVYKCEYCCVIFQDAAMYHLHRSMHDKMDIRCCNMCGKLASDKYDFIAHYLSEHK
ncbi:zinc finger protein 271-like [Saccostrea cucullata]|uniref:zinc finger protein 271-like n=1 Tax=Saccostrea cuccullata TaxID=36930 RepID=UPI002ED3C217